MKQTGNQNHENSMQDCANDKQQLPDGRFEIFRSENGAGYKDSKTGVA